MSQGTSEITVSDLKVGDVVEVHTERSVYRCVIQGADGEAKIESTNRRFAGPYDGQIIGTAVSGTPFLTGKLKPGGRFLFFCDRGDVSTSQVQRIVVNGSLVLAHFG